MGKRKPRKTTERDGILHTYRKVVQIGDTVLVSIPKKWAKEHDLKKGDEMTMTANNIITMVKSPKKLEGKEV